MRRHQVLSVGLTSLLALAAHPQEALAYRQAKTCVTDQERNPHAPSLAPGCMSGERGWPVSWPRLTVGYKIHRDISHGDLTQQDILAATHRGMSAWNAPDCSGFTFKEMGFTEISRHDPSDSVRVITIINQGWPDTTAAIALTTTTMTQRGELVDADMEINGEFHELRVSGEPIGVDLANTIAHEAGHMLGLDHSSERQATMHFESPDGELIKRDLHPDDIAGLCAIYPRGLPERIYVDEVDQRGCCATAPAGSSSAVIPWWLLATACAVCGERLARAWRPRRATRAE